MRKDLARLALAAVACAPACLAPATAPPPDRLRAASVPASVQAAPRPPIPAHDRPIPARVRTMAALPSITGHPAVPTIRLQAIAPGPAAPPRPGNPADPHLAAPDSAGTHPAAPDDAGSHAAGPRPESFTVVATGDILLHRPLILQARHDGGGELDFLPMFRGVRKQVAAADLALCHLETPLAPRRGPYTGYPLFSAPPQVLTALVRVGYDGCSTASNHTLDQGEPGVRRTLQALDRAGLAHTGSARNARESRKNVIYDVKGVRVAHLSYTYGTNGIPVPKGRPWLVNDSLDPARITAAARRAKARGADVVIVSLHWGEEYQHAPSAQQRAVAKAVLASPAVDLIVGHHAHVVQPFDRIRGKWVAYGLGNQVANPSANLAATHEGVLARFRFERTGDGWRARPAFVPTKIVAGPPIRLRPAVLPGVAEVVRSLGERVPILK
ncbi:CapA family protein [Nonomuraea sp. NPDC050310]|uniref:CapA family protein n=1 Tax=Nonomuraea sp. NPDC050310 TaxID=3154935 RepID=UPI0033CA62AE